MIVSVSSSLLAALVQLVLFVTIVIVSNYWIVVMDSFSVVTVPSHIRSHHRTSTTSTVPKIMNTNQWIRVENDNNRLYASIAINNDESITTKTDEVLDEISTKHPLRVLIAGGGVGPSKLEIFLDGTTKHSHRRIVGRMG
jgi:hypothetical protein